MFYLLPHPPELIFKVSERLYDHLFNDFILSKIKVSKINGLIFEVNYTEETNFSELIFYPDSGESFYLEVPDQLQVMNHFIILV